MLNFLLLYYEIIYFYISQHMKSYFGFKLHLVCNEKGELLNTTHF